MNCENVKSHDDHEEGTVMPKNDKGGGTDAPTNDEKGKVVQFDPSKDPIPVWLNYAHKLFPTLYFGLKFISSLIEIYFVNIG